MPSRDRLLDVRFPERLVRADIGPPILYCLLDDTDAIVVVKRHHDGVHTVPCFCEPACPTSRDDYFMRALRLSSVDSAGNRVWEPVVLHLTDQAIRTLERLCQEGGLPPGMAGVLFRLRRHGNNANGRVVVTEVSKTSSPPTTTTNVRAVLASRRVMGFAPLFNGHHAPEPVNADQAVPPARSRNEKPRVPKGTRG